MKNHPVFLFLLLWILGGLLFDSAKAQSLGVSGNARVRGILVLTYPVDYTTLAIGYATAQNQDLSALRSNIFIGIGTAHENTIGKFNTVNGDNAFVNNKAGTYNTAIGYFSLYNNNYYNSDTSHYNTAVGALSLLNQRKEGENCAIGYQAGKNCISGRWNTFLGSIAGRDLEIGDNNVFIGQACRVLGTGGSNNVIIGNTAGYLNNGSNNVFVGDKAGQLNQGSNNIFLGFEAAKNRNTGSNMLWIENSSGSTPLIYGDFANNRIGINCTNPQDELSVYGDIMATGNISTSFMACSSDRRLKKDILPLQKSLKSFTRLRPVRYNWRTDEFPERNLSEKDQVGFIAQEVEAIYPELVYKDDAGFESLDYSRLTVILTSAIQDLSEENRQLRIRYRSLINRIEALEANSLIK